MADQLPAGPALDAAACQALHAALLADGKPELAREWEPSYDLRILDDGEPYEVALERFVSSDGNVMLLALEHMRELGWLGKLGALIDGWVCTLMPLEPGFTLRQPYQQVGDTAQEAVARAVVAFR